MENLARQTAVRIQTGKSFGSGTIVRRQGQTYTVLTNWHVVAIVRGDRTIVTGDGLLHRPLGVPRRLGDIDLAIVEFRSAIEYKVAPISAEPAAVGEPLLAAGFPVGAEELAVARGFVELLPPKSLPQGYSLGYTNEVKIGMSGGPIFNAKGFLVGINGRGKYRDPDFGVYAFEDGSEPTAELLEKMVKSSWGIPISIYWQFVSSHLGS
ncbi:serine protease [Microcoleus vaginatus GB1-A2]|uniref:trypsin-like peptidase domain-containing protein n=1 Tax=Microcoleus vaginatus TaxID=119532 RepID=UPI0016872055|nr:trypsin-like peptidase domain-containing protein [Microcoleus sp. FACHB-61]